MNKFDEIKDEEMAMPSVVPSPGPMISSEIEEGEEILEVQDDSTVENPSIHVTIDNTPEDVLSLDKEGRLIYFESGDLFRKLPSEVVRQLSSRTKNNYFIAKGLTEESLSIGKSDRKDAAMREIEQKFSVPGGTATERLTVRDGNPSMAYSHFSTRRYGYAKERGWVPCSKDEVNAYTSNLEGSSVLLNDQRGNPELILMKKPKEIHEKEQADISRHRRFLRGKLKEQDLAQTGGHGFDPEERFMDKKWKPI